MHEYEKNQWRYILLDLVDAVCPAPPSVVWPQYLSPAVESPALPHIHWPAPEPASALHSPSSDPPIPAADAATPRTHQTVWLCWFDLLQSGELLCQKQPPTSCALLALRASLCSCAHCCSFSHRRHCRASFSLCRCLQSNWALRAWSFTPCRYSWRPAMMPSRSHLSASLAAIWPERVEWFRLLIWWF